MAPHVSSVCGCEPGNVTAQPGAQGVAWPDVLGVPWLSTLGMAQLDAWTCQVPWSSAPRMVQLVMKGCHNWVFQDGMVRCLGMACPAVLGMALLDA